MAITITLARTGVIGYETAVALVLGENIGTTITAFLASLGSITNAKRTYLDVRIYDTPAIGIQQSYSEIILMGEGVQEMMGWLRSSLESPSGDKLLEKNIFHREKLFVLIQKEIVEFIGKMMTGTLSHDVTREPSP